MEYKERKPQWNGSMNRQQQPAAPRYGRSAQQYGQYGRPAPQYSQQYGQYGRPAPRYGQQQGQYGRPAPRYARPVNPARPAPRYSRPANPPSGASGAAAKIAGEISEMMDVTFTNEVLPVYLLLDKSSSMNARLEGEDATRFDVLKQSVLDLVGLLKGNENTAYTARLTIGAFNDSIEVLCDNVQASDLDEDELKKRLNGVHPAGVTLLGRSILQAVEHVNALKESLAKKGTGYYQPVVVVVSDGEATNQDGAYSVQSMSQAFHLCDGLIDQGKLTVLPLGVGSAEQDEFEMLDRLVKKQLDGGAKTPVLRNAQDVRLHFQFLAQTITALPGAGDDAAQRRDAMEKLGYVPVRI